MTRITRIASATAVAVTFAIAATPVRAQDTTQPTVVVMPFVNYSRGPDARQYDGVGTAIAEFITTALSANERLRVTPREQGQRALTAQHPGNGVADRAAAVGAGRAVSARFVIVGGYSTDTRGFMRIDGRGLDAGTGEVLFTERVQGRADDVVALAEGLGARISAGLQWPPGKTGTAGTPIAALRAAQYGRALELADRGDRAHAIEALQALLKDAPDYAPAQRALTRLTPAP